MVSWLGLGLGLGLGEAPKVLQSAGQRVGKLEVLVESEKAVDNGCFGGRSGCLFRSPCCGNSSVLKLFLGGKGISLLLCVAPPCGGQTT